MLILLVYFVSSPVHERAVRQVQMDDSGLQALHKQLLI